MIFLIWGLHSLCSSLTRANPFNFLNFFLNEIPITDSIVIYRMQMIPTKISNLQLNPLTQKISIDIRNSLFKIPRMSIKMSKLIKVSKINSQNFCFVRNTSTIPYHIHFFPLLYFKTFTFSRLFFRNPKLSHPKNFI